MNKLITNTLIAAVLCVSPFSTKGAVITASYNFQSDTVNSWPSGWIGSDHGGQVKGQVLLDSGLLFQSGTGNKFLCLTNTGTSAYGHNITANSGTANDFGVVGQVDLKFVLPNTNKLSFLVTSTTTGTTTTLIPTAGYYQLRVGSGTASSNATTAFSLAIGAFPTFTGTVFTGTTYGLYRTDGDSSTGVIRETAPMKNVNSQSNLNLQFDTLYALKIVYNNSGSMIAYTAASGTTQTLTANSADVWLSGTWLGLIRKSGGTNGVGIPTGTPIANFNIASKSTTMGSLNLDDIIISGINQQSVPTRPAAISTIFSDTFDSNANNTVPQGWTSNEHSGTTTTRAILDSASLFGRGPANKYVELYHASDNSVGHSFFVSSTNPNFGTVGQVTFRLVLPTGTRTLNSTGLYRARLGINPNNDGTTFAIGIKADGLYGIQGTSDTSIPTSGTFVPLLLSWSATAGQVYDLKMVFNNSSTPVNYGPAVVAANTMDVWSGTTLLRAGILKCGGTAGNGIASGTSLTTFDFNSSGPTVGSIYVDEVNISSIGSGATQTDITNLQQTLNKALPGDVVTLNSGTYRNYGTLVFDQNSGTSGPGITLKAASGGGVTFTGNMQCILLGSNLEFRNFCFDGVHNDVNVFVFDNCSYSRLTQCVFKDIDNVADVDNGMNILRYHNPNAEVVVLKNGSQYNTISNNTITNNWCQGIGIRVDGTYDPYNLYNTIQQNLFINVPQDNVNGGECIQIGETFGDQDYPSYTNVSQNVFMKADGDNETISVKSSRNFIRDNIFDSCVGSVTLRSANECYVERNYFVACTAPGGVLRTYGTNHYVGYNYIDGKDYSGTVPPHDVTYMGIRIEGGHTASGVTYLNNTANRYYNNTILNTGTYGIKVIYNDPSGTNWVKPTGCYYYNNLIEMSTGVIMDGGSGSQDSPTYSLNMAHVTGTAASYGTLSLGPGFSGTSSCLKIKSGIAGVDTVQGSSITCNVGDGSIYTWSGTWSGAPVISSTDFDGESASLDNHRDIGCDECALGSSGRPGGVPPYGYTAGASWWMTGTNQWWTGTSRPWWSGTIPNPRWPGP